MQRPPPENPHRRDRKPPGVLADEARIRVNALMVTGQTVYRKRIARTHGLHAGQRAEPHRLRVMAAKISDFYHRNGYVVAQAYLPAQDIKAGRVAIAVIEGRYGSVDPAQLLESLRRSRHGLLGGLNTGDTITIARSRSGCCFCRTSPASQ